MSKKITVSLSDPTSERLGQWVMSLGSDGSSNPSVVVEAALIYFGELDRHQQNRRIRELQASRKATSRDGWVALFWEALSEEFDARDIDTAGRRLMAVRTYGGFNVVYLMQNPSTDDGRIHLQVHPAPPHGGWVEPPVQYFQISPADSAYRVAAQIAAWIRDQRAEREAL
jgi:hypothetical protein